MSTVKKWIVASIIGLIVVAMGSTLALMGADSDRHYEGEVSVEEGHIYFFNFEVSAGGTISGAYEISNGTMTIAVINQEGHQELKETGVATDENTVLLLTGRSSGNYSCTVPTSDVYYLCFYSLSFIGTGVVLSSSGTYHGSASVIMNAGLIGIGVGVAIIGGSIYMRYRAIRLLQMKEEMKELMIDPRDRTNLQLDTSAQEKIDNPSGPLDDPPIIEQ